MSSSTTAPVRTSSASTYDDSGIKVRFFLPPPEGMSEPEVRLVVVPLTKSVGGTLEELRRTTPALQVPDSELVAVLDPSARTGEPAQLLSSTTWNQVRHTAQSPSSLSLSL